MKIIELFYNFVFNASLIEVFLVLLFLFTALYFSVTLFFQSIVHFTLQKKLSEKIILTKKFPRQISYEIAHSFFSILVFALYGFLIIILIRNQILDIRFNLSYTVLIDLLILVIWNEIHFYICHRIMHTPHLIKFHGVHHRSVVVTPFSTYSFHPLESVINGTVMIIPMFVYSFEVLALFIFPIYHLIFNAIGHTNIRLKGYERIKKLTGISFRHNLHHTKFNVNFGFMSPIMDYLFTKDKKHKL